MFRRFRNPGQDTRWPWTDWVRGAVLMTTLWILCGLGLGWLSSASGQETTEDLAEQLPRIPASSPDEAMTQFHVQPGFQIQRVAAEPLLATPVAITWDAAGRMYVCEMRGYSEHRNQNLSRIRLLEDRDQDGVYETAQVFADQLAWPTALFPYRGGLFVGDAPNILYLKDTDGDGIADQKRVVLTGFGTSNVQGLLNSFRWGLDQRIHVACSSAGGQVRRPDQTEDQAVEIRGRDLAFDPDTMAFTLTSGGAQHGMGFDDWGRKFTCSNSDHLQQVMYEDRYIARNRYLAAPSARVSIAKDGPQAPVFRTSPVEPWRIVRTRLRVDGKVPGPIEGGGRPAGYFTGATGATIYRGDQWPDEFRGMAVIGDVGSNLVHRKKLERQGVQMVAQRIDPDSEFVTSDDIWFRPAQFANAPDGTLYVIDVCREVIEHPKSLPPAIKQHLDLASGRDRGRIYRLAPDDFRYRPTPDMSQASIARLVDWIDHPNAWHRETAARLLYQKRDARSVSKLRQVVSSGQYPEGRLQAVALLSAMGECDTATVVRACQDPHPMVRRYAVLAAERDPRNPDIQRALQPLRYDPDPEVRLQLAFTVGELPKSVRDQWLLVLLRQSPTDRWFHLAIQSSLHDGAAGFLTALFEDRRLMQAVTPDWITGLVEQVGQQSSPDQIVNLLPRWTRMADNDPVTSLIWTGKLQNQLARRSESTWNPIRHALGRSILELVDPAIRLALDTDHPLSERLVATQALQYGTAEAVTPVLTEMLDPRQPIELQRMAIQTAGTFPQTQLCDLILERWDALSPSVRTTALDILLSRPDWTLVVLREMTEGRKDWREFGVSWISLAARSDHPEIRQRANEILTTTNLPQASTRYQKYRAILTQEGNRGRGGELFARHCASCHRWKEKGHDVGPDLATLKNRGMESLLWNVLEPNREVNPEYLNYLVITDEGRIHTGMIRGESASSIELKQAEGQIRTLLRRNLQEIRNTGLSLMPEGFDQVLTPADMRDLLTFLTVEERSSEGQQ